MPRSLPSLLSILSLLGLNAFTAAADEPAKPEAEKKQTLIEIGKETTGITKPLDAQGYVDYVEAANQRMSKGVTPENNFEVVVRRVLGPQEISEPYHEEYFRRLGIPVPTEGKFFVDYLAFVQSESLTEEQRDALFEEDERIGSQPWNSKDFPRAAKWLESEKAHLDALVQGSQRPRNYTPYIGGDFDEKDPGPRMIAVLLPSAQQQRSIARALNKRVMLRIGEGRFDEAWSDLQGMHRVARHAASGLTLIEALVGLAIDSIAFQGEAQLLASPDLTTDQCKRFLADLRTLPAMSSMADKIDVGERWMGLDCVTSIGRKNVKDLVQMLNTINELSDAGARADVPVGLSFVSTEDDSKEEAEKDPKARPLEYTIDWNVTLRLMNGWYDRLAAAAREPDFAKRAKAFESINDDLKRLAAESQNPTKILFRLAANPKPREELGRTIGNILVALLVPAIQTVRTAEDRAIARRDLITLGFAARVYRAEKGRSPRTLEELVPTYAKAIPEDAMTGEAYSYAATKTGFVIYSLGDNRVDDGGRGYDDRTDAREDWDDIAVRVGK